MCSHKNSPNQRTIYNGKRVEFVFQGEEAARLFKGEKSDLAAEIASRFVNVQLSNVGESVQEVIGLPGQIDVTVFNVEPKEYSASASWQLGGDRHASFLVTDTGIESQTLLTVARPVPRSKHARVVMQLEANSVEGEGGESMTVWLDKNHTLGVVHAQGQHPPKGENVAKLRSGLYMIGDRKTVKKAFEEAFPNVNFEDLAMYKTDVVDGFVPKLWGILFEGLLDHYAGLKERETEN